MEQTMQQRRRRRAFTPAFKAEVVELCRKGSRSIPEVARDLDLTETAVRRWVTQAEIDRGSRPGLTSSEQAELAQLRRDNRQLREDLGIMKRAAAFFARRPGEPVSVHRGGESGGAQCQPCLRRPRGLPSRLLRVAQAGAGSAGAGGGGAG